LNVPSLDLDLDRDRDPDPDPDLDPDRRAGYTKHRARLVPPLAS
jgi:hypothetical protein